MRRDGFVLRVVRGVAYYSCRAFEELPGLGHGFSTRRGGAPAFAGNRFNLGDASWDTPERIQENRHRFLGAVRLEGARLATLRQIHSDRVYIIRDLSAQWNRPEGDALATALEDVALAVQVADCLPVLLADPVTKVVAAIHSGWRGIVSHILPKAVQEIQRSLSVDPAHLLAAVGPGIRSCCFEVGPEVAARFDREFPRGRLTRPAETSPGKYYLDLVGALEFDFVAAGIKPEKCHDSGLCTCCNISEFFSHRAEKDRAGRMMAVIGRIGTVSNGSRQAAHGHNFKI
jgi:YfiH family protein